MPFIGAWVLQQVHALKVRESKSKYRLSRFLGEP